MKKKNIKIADTCTIYLVLKTTWDTSLSSVQGNILPPPFHEKKKYELGSFLLPGFSDLVFLLTRATCSVLHSREIR